MIIEKETLQGREGTACVGWKSIPESVLAIRTVVSGIADSLRQRAGARDILGSETALAEETRTLPQIALA